MVNVINEILTVIDETFTIERLTFVLVIATIALVFVTAYYAYLTRRMAIAAENSSKIMAAQTEAMMQPHIIAVPFIRPSTNIIYLKIQNIGCTAAEEVRLSLDRDFFMLGDHSKSENNLRMASIFSESTDSLPPGFELHFALAQGHNFFGPNSNPEITPAQFSITAKYSYSGKYVEKIMKIDLRSFLMSEGKSDPIVDQLKLIREAIDKKHL